MLKRNSQPIPRKKQGRIGLVVKYWPRSRRVQAQNTIPLKLRCMLRLLLDKSYVGGDMPSHWCGEEASRGGCHLRCRPRHLKAVPNYEDPAKIAFVLLQNNLLQPDHSLLRE
ncbi:hypothetical protein AVEN_242228-1 [Araneus ventricosus]|uniref:Uncharacterized protein n=1 Tax=Araneus ventricosus TaxID=182803 RepID=A0A4Y2FS96_ARAVE|nr:hypothetical protein AVEN_242228-1 [Araneus ventricosus]